MRRLIFLLGFSSAFFLAACSSGDKGVSPADNTPPLSDLNTGGDGALPGSAGAPGANASDDAQDPIADGTSAPDADPNAGNLPDGALPPSDTPADPQLPPDDTDLPGHTGDIPDSDDPSGHTGAAPPGHTGDILASAELPTTWGDGEPLVGSAFTADTFPSHLIVSGGPGKDGIPALTNPPFVAAGGAANWLHEDDLILGVVIDGVAKAYPHNIGWWHEIVNDKVGDQAICVTFCPLTGTGLVYDATDDDGSQFELGVSGLLYNNNLIMYDRRDGFTLYPQIFSTAVAGERSGQPLSLMPVVETTWATWKKLYPDTQVIAQGTYNSSQYNRYPYGDYRTNDSFLLFNLSPTLANNANPYANIFGSKDGMLGVRLDGQARAYLFDTLDDQAAINDQVGGVDIIVVWDRANSLAIPYARQLGDLTLSFDVDQSAGFPFNLVDRETGSVWNVKGEAIDGPLTGNRLAQVPAHNSFWFAWVTFWRDTDIWKM